MRSARFWDFTQRKTVNFNDVSGYRIRPTWWLS